MKYFYYNYDNEEILEYDDLYELFEDIIDEDYIIDILNEVYPTVNLPVIGQKGYGDILKAFDVIDEKFFEEEIDYLCDEAEYQIDHNNYYDFSCGIISNSKETLERLIKE